MLLLDALDEVVDPTARQRVVAEARLRTGHGEGNEILVTSRIAGFPGTLTGYRQLEVEALKEAQIAAFVHGLVCRHAGCAGARAPCGGAAAGARAQPALRALASNPLLLSLMTLLYENRWDCRSAGRWSTRSASGCIAEWDRRRAVTRAPRFSRRSSKRS